MQHWWRDCNRGKPKYSEKTPTQYHLINHKSHTDWTGTEHRPLWWEATNCLRHGTAIVSYDLQWK